MSNPPKIDLSQYQSLTTTQGYSTTSDRYRFIPTTDAIEVFTKMNFLPYKVSEVAVRDPQKQGYQKHIIRFRHTEAQPIVLGSRDVLYPELVLTNSHDGLSCFILRYGIYRCVCTNGLIVGESIIPPMKVKHIGFSPLQLEETIVMIQESTPQIRNRINEWNTIEMTKDDQNQFVMQGLQIRFTEKELNERSFTNEKILKPRRPDDTKNNLWTVFNKTQEALINGGYYEYKTTHYGSIHLHKVRKVKSVDENVRINKLLWDQAEKYALNN